MPRAREEPQRVEMGGQNNQTKVAGSDHCAMRKFRDERLQGSKPFRDVADSAMITKVEAKSIIAEFG